MDRDSYEYEPIYSQADIENWMRLCEEQEDKIKDLKAENEKWRNAYKITAEQLIQQANQFKQAIGDMPIEKVAEMCKAVSLAEQKMVIMPCKWTLLDDDFNTYSTGCGELFCIENGTPKENKLKFCAYCGRKLEVSK